MESVGVGRSEWVGMLVVCHGGGGMSVCLLIDCWIKRLVDGRLSA